jgi:hypothetical protein
VFPSIGLDLKRLATLLVTPRHLLLPTGAFFPRNYLTAIGYDFSFSFLTKSPTTSIFEEKQDDIHSFQPTTVFSRIFVQIKDQFHRIAQKDKKRCPLWRIT